MNPNQIILGNCLNYLPQIDKESIHLTFTSPPYFNTKEYSHYMTYDIYLEFLTNVFKEVYRVTLEGRFLVINISPVIEPRQSRNTQSKRYPIPFDLHPILKDIGWDFQEDIIWEKPEGSAKNRNAQFFQTRKPVIYKPNIVTEYVLVYRKRTNRLPEWNIRQYYKEVIESSLVKDDDYERTNLWKINPTYSKKHPAVFPKELVEKVIKYYSMKGDNILDPFGGIGTTCHAAYKLDRNCISIEIDEDYYNESLIF
jgi:DNA modification methylase